MDAAKGRLLMALPIAARFHLELGRLPRRCDQVIDAGLSPRGLLSRMLLGADGRPFCSRRDEPFLDRSARYPRPARESHAVRRGIARLAGIAFFVGGVWM